MNAPTPCLLLVLVGKQCILGLQWPAQWGTGQSKWNIVTPAAGASVHMLSLFPFFGFSFLLFSQQARDVECTYDYK
jgi:hypothetical protein